MPYDLKPLSEQTLQEIDRVSARVETEVLERCLSEDAPTESMGEQAETMIRNGLGFVTRMLRATMQFAAEPILDDEVAWGKTRLPIYGVSASMVLRNFERYADALRRHLAASTFAEVEPYVHKLLDKQRAVSAAEEDES
jgi:hypothetical protein